MPKEKILATKPFKTNVIYRNVIYRNNMNPTIEYANKIPM